MRSRSSGWGRPSIASAERTVWLLGIGSFAASASLRATDPLLAKLSEHFAVTAGAAAVATVAFFVAYGTFQLVHGPLGDRLGKVRMIAFYAAFAAATSLGCALAPSMDALVAARFIAGCFIGGLIPLSMAWIGDVVPYERRQAVLARFMLGQVGGTVAALAVGGWFAEHLSWRGSFVMIAAVFAVASVALALDLRSNPVHRGATVPRSARRQSLALLALPWVRVVLACVFFEAAFGFAAMAYIPLHLHRVHGFSLSASGFMVALFALGTLTYAVLGPRLVKAMGERGLVRWGGVATASAYLVLATSPWGWFAVAVLPVMGLGLAWLHGTLQVHATQMAPESRGAAVSAFAFALFAGQSLGTWLGSLVIDTRGTAPIHAAAALGVLVLSLVFRAALGRRESGRHSR